MATRLTFPETALLLKARPGYLHLGHPPTGLGGKQEEQGCQGQVFPNSLSVLGMGKKSCQPPLSAQAAGPALQKNTA